jgi:hypothetical protein
VLRTETQLHGYRQGHQLLDGKALSKVDQGLIDRLSDLAGPLRPGETFEPYMTGYPLPSGQFYVLARTWQDLAVSRAGCVRTLSLIIPVDEWARSETVAPYFDFLSERQIPSFAEPAAVAPAASPLPPIAGFDGWELLEALFLEDLKPIVVFDAVRPEPIVVRLLSALWPGLRERFSVSTFALSPRKIEGAFFDLVFAPKDVKARFTNWHGRRIDARSEASSRHRWTSAIVERVFKDAYPQLLRLHDLEALDPNQRSSSSALRLSLLWDELLEKLQVSPSAALGLLDVANSKFSHSPAVNNILPLLANATTRAAFEMLPADGWAFVAAMLRKVQHTPFSVITPEITNAGRVLAQRAPGRAISFLEQPDPTGSYSALTSGIAGGLYNAFNDGAEQALIGALPETLARVLKGDGDLARAAVRSPAILQRIAEVLPALSPVAFDGLRGKLLPLLGNEEQIDLASAFLRTLSRDQLLEEVNNLARLSSAPDAFAREIVSRAKALNDEVAVREKARDLGDSTIAHQLLAASLMPVPRDVRWVLDRLPQDRSTSYLVDLLLAATGPQLAEIFSDHELACQVLPAIGDDNVALLYRVAVDVWLPLDLLVSVVQRIEGKLENADDSSRLVKHALKRCLREHFSGNESAFLRHLLEVSQGVDAGWLIQQGLAGHITSSVVSRNIRAFDSLSGYLRTRLVRSIDVAGEVLSGRWKIDLDAGAAFSLSNLLGASGHEDQRATLRACAYLLPALMRSKDWPISPVIAATFPYVYAELAREDDVPDLLRFIPFVDWDRCKAARHELVDSFLSAELWRPRDLAYTACRCQDAERFMKRILKDKRGQEYLWRLESELAELPMDCVNQVTDAIARVRQ